MKSNRSTSPLRMFVVILFGFTVALSYDFSEATLNLPPAYQQHQHQQSYLTPGFEETLPHRTKWSDAAYRLMKRKKGDRFLDADELRYFSEKQVDEASKVEYKVVPDPIITTSKMIHEGVNCSAIESDLHKNYIKPDHQLRPEWMHTSQLIGTCPTHYVTRELPPMYSPSLVVEAVCKCPDSKCSQEGHQCFPVSRQIPVWVRKGPNYHVLDVEELTIACACLRRPSVPGEFIFTSGIEN